MNKQILKFSASAWPRKALLLPLAILATTACSETYINEDVSPQGTVPLEKITLGVPESSLREAVITFIKDPSAKANAGGKTQYLSRDKTVAGGQYMVQCKDGAVFQIAVLHKEPVDKDTALLEMKKLLPGDTPPQSRVDETATKDTYYWGGDYSGELNLNGAAKVVDIYVTNLTAAQKADQDVEADKLERKALVDEALKEESNKTDGAKNKAQ